MLPSNTAPARWNDFLKKRNLMLIHLVSRGAESIFDDEGQDILDLLHEQNKEYLASGLASIGTALRWLNQQSAEQLAAEDHPSE